VAFAVLRDAVPADLEQETDALHGMPLSYEGDRYTIGEDLAGADGMALAAS
jgi:hypothetical protein